MEETKIQEQNTIKTDETTKAETTEQDSVKTETKAVPASTVFRNEVETFLAENGAKEVREALKSILVKEKVEERTKTLRSGLDKLLELRGKLKSIRPDQESFDANGKPVATTYSSAKVKELKKAQELVEKMETALTEALNEFKYEKLEKVLAETKNSGQSSTEAK